MTNTNTILDSEELKARVDRFHVAREAIVREVRKVIVGQEETIDHVLIALFTGGHCLITGLPGTAKTLLVRTLAQTLGLQFKRIQFTPDLMPSDITGTDIIEEDPATGRRTWTFVPGPIFANVLLADEINRTPPKTQSALLEAMQELSCTVRGRGYRIEPPFFVLATQNPIELEGTYPLPEAQLDRFLFNTILGYLSAEDELKVVDLTTTTTLPTADTVTNVRRDFGISEAGAHGSGGRKRGAARDRPGAGDAAGGRDGAGIREEVCEFRCERAGGAVPGVGGEGAGADAWAVSRGL